MEKQEQRKFCLENRRKLTTEQREEYSKRICKTLSGLLEFKNAKCILSYCASWDEADPKYLDLEGKRVCYPISFDGGIMKAYIPSENDGWEEGKFGIKSPKLKNASLVSPEDIDLVIVPCVGFDENKQRLGHGKGYYDRYIPQCVKASMICIAFEAQKLDNTAVDKYDIPMAFVITEKNIY